MGFDLMTGMTVTEETATIDQKETFRRRTTAVVAAVAVAAAAWILIELVAGFDLRGPVFDGSSANFDIGLLIVMLSTAIPTLLGWGLLALLERWTTRPRLIWTMAAIVVFTLSLGQPLSGTGVGVTDRLLLELFHVLVAVVYIPLMRRSIRSGVTSSDLVGTS